MKLRSKPCVDMINIFRIMDFVISGNTEDH
jgi:hypothetical protein